MTDSPRDFSTGVVLVGHGVPASDCPARLVGELMALQWSGDAGGHGHSEAGSSEGRIRELDAQIRDWPRRSGNDPYKEGLERLADVLRRMLSCAHFEVGYNEFCRPSVPEAIEAVIGRGASRVLVIPSMVTPGGVHSEKDIPREVQGMRQKHPAVRIEYVWPFDLREVAGLLAAHLRRAEEERPA